MIITVQTVLQTIGIAATTFLSIATLKFCYSIFQSCDFTTAITSNASPTAFDAKVVWITGGSSGVGLELAKQIMHGGTAKQIILSSRRPETLRQAANELRAAAAGGDDGGDVVVSILALDLSKLDTLQGKVMEALQLSLTGSIDILINNGGVSTRAFARDASLDVDKYLATVDYLSAVALTKPLLSIMDKNTAGGLIINIGSVASKLGTPVRTAYCGAKFALFGYFEALRIEEIIRNPDNKNNTIRIINVAAGSIAGTQLAQNAVVSKPTDLFGRRDPNLDAGLSLEYFCNRVLAMAARRNFNGEVWIAKGKELLILYLHQYVPVTSARILTKSMARQYAVQREGGGAGEKGDKKEL